MTADPVPLPVEEFLHEIKGLRDTALHDIISGKYGVPTFFSDDPRDPANRPEVVFLLQLGVYPERREVDLLARQIQRLDDADLVYRVGGQIFDEAKHTKVLRDQLIAWDIDPDVFWEQPIYQWSAAFDYMDKLTHPVEYFACSNYIGEGLFLPTIMAPMAKYDPETFKVYVEQIIPDEPRHVRIGKDVIAKYCTTLEVQNRVRRVATILTKQYCIGFEAAMKFAEEARQGVDPNVLRDGPVSLPQLEMAPRVTGSESRTSTSPPIADVSVDELAVPGRDFE